MRQIIITVNIKIYLFNLIFKKEIIQICRKQKNILKISGEQSKQFGKESLPRLLLKVIQPIKITSKFWPLKS